MKPRERKERTEQRKGKENVEIAYACAASCALQTPSAIIERIRRKGL